MPLGVLVKRGKHDRENDLDVVTDQVTEILIIPEVKSTFSNLEMRAGDGFGQLMKERLLDLRKLCRVHNLEDILHLVQEHDLFGAVDLGPVS
jgi:hypothetical protein